MIAVNKKYIFDKRKNCINRPFGIKVIKLYLFVVIVLSCNLNSLFLILLFIKNSKYCSSCFS